jgi:hypothetical protein
VMSVGAMSLAKQFVGPIKEVDGTDCPSVPCVANPTRGPD